MSKGFYKKMGDGSWSYGTKVYAPTYKLTYDNRLDGNDGWVWYDEEPEGFSWEAPEEDSLESREIIIDELTEAAEASGLGIPFESFYYKHRKTILKWIKDGGDDLKEIFTTSEEVWLDMRENEDTPSPREFALNLLEENDSFIN